jgi:hypothetical protein
MALDRIVVGQGPLRGSYTLLPSHTIEQFESLGIGDEPFTYRHERARRGWCWDCDQPIWADQPYEYDEDGMYHPACLWDRSARMEFETNLYKPRYIVAVWDHDRAFGGNEEGGWWYDVGSLVLSVECHSEEAAQMIREGLEIEYPRTGRASSVLGGDDFDVLVHDRHDGDWDSRLDCRLDLIGHYPARRPYYE